MKKLGARGQKILKSVHLILAGMWIGGALGLTLMIACLGPAASGGELYGYDLAMKFIDDALIIPGAMGCLLSGLLISLFTPWGFFKHRWVAVKWILTVGCILFGTFYLGPQVNGRPPISEALGLAALNDAAYNAAHSRNFFGGLAQFGAIVFMTAISVIKPWRKKATEK
ncbi:hypothetical protein LJB99_06130 [Deltaproteobacteria bacterium OttesenSCG-928-K17]|nr:hypothetical protein [Deltaproteobacteria bacterium OttesenSCG-928-K17]